jgi:hypothetical protein
VRSLSSTVVVIVAVVVAVAFPEGAEGAATLTLGSLLPMTGGASACHCTLLQHLGASSADAFVAPVGGVITRWRTRNVSAQPGPTPQRGLALRVLRANGGSSYTALATSDYVIPAGSGVETFAAHLSVGAGQYVGLDDPEGMFIGVQDGVGSLARVAPPLSDGTTASFAPDETGELTFNFDLLPTPTISALAAAQGTGANETVVGVSGSSFEEVEAVTFGGTPFAGITIGGIPAASYTVRSENLVTAIVPAGEPSGSLSVGVTTPAGTATESFDYAAPDAPAVLPAPPLATTPAAPRCRVPQLQGQKLKASKKKIRAADCRLGKLTRRRGATARTGRVVKQTPKSGASVPAGTKVKVTLGPG